MHYKLNTLSEHFLIRFHRIIFLLNMLIIHLKVHGTKQIITKCTLTFMWNQTNHHKMYNIDIYVPICITKLRVILSSRQILTTKYLLTSLFDIYSHKIRNLL